MRNECGKTVDKAHAYEVWSGSGWTWHVLKKYQSAEREAANQYARWFCLVTSPFCPEGEMGDVYVRDVTGNARRIK